MENHPLILAVDDDWKILKLISVNLGVDGYSVIGALDGVTALAMMEQYQPDLVLLDVMMPGINGIDLISHIRERTDTPIIMLSGNHDTDCLRRALECGADDYITKPFNPRLLSARIRAKLRRDCQPTSHASVS